MPPRRCWREKGHHPREDTRRKRPTRRTIYLKLPSFRSRAVCQVVRSSSAKNLSSQNTLESQGFRRMFKRYLFGTTFASSSPLTPAKQSRLCGVFRACRNTCDIPEDLRGVTESLTSNFLNFGRKPAHFYATARSNLHETGLRAAPTALMRGPLTHIKPVPGSTRCGVSIPSRSRVASHQPWDRAVSRER